MLAEKSFQARRASFMRTPTSNSLVAGAACLEVSEGWGGTMGGAEPSCSPDGRLGLQRWGTPTASQLAAESSSLSNALAPGGLARRPSASGGLAGWSREPLTDGALEC